MTSWRLRHTRNSGKDLAVDEAVILLHPTLPLAGVPIGMKRGCLQNDRTLADD